MSNHLWLTWLTQVATLAVRRARGATQRPLRLLVGRQLLPPRRRTQSRKVRKQRARRPLPSAESVPSAGGSSRTVSSSSSRGHRQGLGLPPECSKRVRQQETMQRLPRRGIRQVGRASRAVTAARMVACGRQVCSSWPAYAWGNRHLMSCVGWHIRYSGLCTIVHVVDTSSSLLTFRCATPG